MDILAMEAMGTEAVEAVEAAEAVEAIEAVEAVKTMRAMITIGIIRKRINKINIQISLHIMKRKLRLL